MKATYDELFAENKFLKKRIKALETDDKSEKALRESVGNFGSIFENSHSGIALVGMDGKYLLVNPAVCEIFGYTSEELMTMDFYKITHPDDLELSRNIFKIVIEGGSKGIIYTIRYIHKKGHIIWVEVNSSLVYDKNNKPSHFVTHINNITERKQAEEALIISQAQLSNAMKMAGLGYWEYDVQSDKFTFNDNFYAIFRTTAEQVGGYIMSSSEYASRFVYKDDKALVALEIQRAIESIDPNFSRQLEHRFVYSDGETGFLSVRFFVIKNDKGKTIRTYGVNQDITERKRAEEAIRKSEQKFAKAFNTGSVVMTISEVSTGKFIEVNDTFCSTFGFRKEEAIGKTAAQMGIIENESHRDLYMNDVRKQGFARNIEIDLHTSKREQLHGLVSADYIDFGSEKYLLTTMIDITERKRAEETLQYSEMYFRAMVENASDAITLLDAKGNIVYEGPTVERITGFNTEERAGHSGFENIYQEDRKKVQTILMNVLNNPGKKETLVFRSVKKDGTIWWTEGTVTNLLDKPIIKAIVVNYRDITLRKNAEDALRESEEKFSMAFQMTPVSMAISTLKDGKYMEVNDAFLRLTEFSREKVIGNTSQNMKLWVNPDLREYFRKELKAGRKIQEMPAEINTKSGKKLDILYSAVIIKFGDEPCMISLALDITERKIAEEALRKSQESLSRITSSIDDIIYSINAKTGEFEFLSPVFDRKFGYSLSDIDMMGGRWAFLKKVIADNKNPDFDPVLHDVAKRKLKETPVWEHWWRCKDGTLKYIEDHSVPIFERDNLVRIDGVLRDITDRKHAEDALNEERTLLRTIVNNLPIALYIKDKEGRKIISNPVDLKHIGKPEFEVLGKTDKDFLPDNISSKTVKDDKMVLTTGIPVENKEELITNKLGQSYWILTTKIPRKNQNGEVIGLVGMGLDITDRVKAEKEIAIHNKRLETMFRISQFKAETTQQLLDYSLEEAIKLTESKIGYIHLYNDEAKQLALISGSKNVMHGDENAKNPVTLNLSSAGLMGEAIRKRKPYIENDYRSNRKFKTLLSREQPEIRNFICVPIIVYDKVVATIGIGNKETGYNDIDARQLNILMDSVWKMVEKQEYQEELIIAKEKAEESDKLKSAFLANMSHEIRTPMNAIIGFSEILLKPGLSDEKKNKYTVIVINSCKKLMSIVNDILDISIIDSGQVEIKKENVNINEVVFELFTLYDNIAKSSNISLYFHNTLDNNNSSVYTDKVKLNQILNNLLNNAIKFTNKGQIDFGYEVKKNEIVFYVKDTGIGIPKNLQSAIFERFRQAELELTRQYGGTGLGLSISQKLVELLGGKLWVESEPEKGSTFFFTIPYEQKTPEKKQKIKKSIAIKSKNKVEKDLTILVAEDEEHNFLYIEEVLFESGINLLHATNGFEAVELCKRYPEINLVLMDIKMPKMNGIEATKEIKKSRPDLRIIAVTAFAMESEKRYVLQEGCDDYISKPVSPNLLKAIIKQNIQRKK